MSELKDYIPEGFSLYPFQEIGVKLLTERVRFLLADDPGLGKTIQLITAVNYIAINRLKNKTTRVLVLCPKSMLMTWKRESEKWETPGKINWDIRNWDQLVSKKRLPEIQKNKYDIIIGDESHQAIKNYKAVRCVAFEKLIESAKYVWLSTATPASKSGLDYYTTLKILLPTLFKSWKWYDFQREFCQAVPDEWSHSGFRYEGFRNTKILKELFTKCAIRRKKEDVLPDLPPKVYTNIEVEIDKKLVAQYSNLDISLACDAVEKGYPLPGHIAHVMQATALSKIDSLMEIVENHPADEPLVIFAWHRMVVDVIMDKLKGLGVEADKITGEIYDVEKRQIIVDRFQRKELKRLVLNMQSGGVGLTLTAASTAIYIEFPHSPIHLKQSENRIHRIGSSGNKVNIIRLIGIGTIDAVIFDRLDERMRNIDEVGV